MARGISAKTKKMTLGASLSALGVVILFLGSMLETLDLSMAAIASFLCVFAVIELGGSYPFIIYAVTGILSVILMPYKMSGWFYVLFFGYYPIIKEKLERLKKPIAWLIKLAVLNGAIWVCITVAYFLFLGPTQSKTLIDAFYSLFGDASLGSTVAIATYVLVNVAFVVYDIALTRLITVYLFRLRKKFRFLK
jgi:hypothetical protein